MPSLTRSGLVFTKGERDQLGKAIELVQLARSINTRIATVEQLVASMDASGLVAKPGAELKEGAS